LRALFAKQSKRLSANIFISGRDCFVAQDVLRLLRDVLLATTAE
jgi:hypothetical protein